MTFRHLMPAVAFAAMTLAAPALAATPKTEQVERLCRAVLGAGQHNAATLTLKGDCALAQRDVTGAIRYYRAALKLDPANVDLRADLATLLMLTGQAAEAQPVLKAAAVTNPGHPEGEALAQLGDQLAGAPAAALPQGEWRGSVAVGRAYDSNINAGSSSSTFDAIILGAPLKLTIADEAKGKPSWASEVAGAASYIHVLDANNAVVVSGDARLTVYDTAAEFNKLDASFGVGLVHNEGNLIWSVTPNMQLLWQGGAMSEAGFYLDGRMQLALDSQTALVGFGKGGYSVAKDSAFNALEALVGAGVEYWLNDAVLVGAHVVVERHAAAVATESFTKIGPRLFLNARLTDGLTLNLGYAYSYSAYEETSAVFPTDRRDSQHEFSAGLRQDLSTWTKGLSAEARYSYQNVGSTLDFHDSDRHVVTTSLRYDF